MLGMMRRLSNKTITKVLLSGLVLIFISFGLSNLKSSKDGVVIIEGKSAVSLEDFVREKRVVMQSMSRYYPNLDQNSVDFDQITLNQLIRNRLIDLEVKKLGLNISDDLALNIIRQTKLFHNNGQFDKALFKKILAANHVSEIDYINGIKLSIAASFFSKNLTNFVLPESVVEQFHTYDNQERKIELFTVSKVNNSNVSVSDKEIAAFYEANQDRFYAPEFREIEYLLINQVNKEKGSGFQKIKDIEKFLDEGKNLKQIADNNKLFYTKLPLLDIHGFNRRRQER
jgi:peptidyl-prolyl cis-trans isomerase D